MAKDYQRLWVAATNATDGTQAAQALAEILADKDGKTFALRLDSKDLELCIEMLGDVSADPYDYIFHNLRRFFRASQNTTSNLPKNRLSLSP